MWIPKYLFQQFSGRNGVVHYFNIFYHDCTSATQIQAESRSKLHLTFLEESENGSWEKAPLNWENWSSLHKTSGPNCLHGGAGNSSMAIGKRLIAVILSKGCVTKC
jgi:hypothetical protein